MAVHISGKPEHLKGKDGILILITKKFNRIGTGSHKEYQVRDSRVAGILAKFYDQRVALNFAHGYYTKNYPRVRVEIDEGQELLQAVKDRVHERMLELSEAATPPVDDVFHLRYKGTDLYVSSLYTSGKSALWAARTFTFGEAMAYIELFSDTQLEAV